MALRHAGDPALARLILIFQKLGSPELRARMSQKMGREMLRLIRRQIDAQQDPYGDPWPARKHDGGPALTGLANTFTAGFSERGFRIGFSKWYANVHQHGSEAAGIPRRMIWPTVKRGLGNWGPPLHRVAAESLREAMR